MPQAVKIEEYDTAASAELGLLYDWYVIPSLSLGIGQIYRKIKFSTSHDIDYSDDKISTFETLNFWHLQFGTGFSLFDGFFVIEPYIRYRKINSDDRSNWIFGLDFTFQIL